MCIFTIAACLLTATSVSAQAPLPSNYRTIFSNPDVLVMRVHYGAHEFVPMHDHPAVATLYVYLNNSGEVDLIHEGPGAVVAHRPPTQAGALRIAPSLAERHSVQSNSDTPSDFLRVEFRHIDFTQLPEAGKRVPAPINPPPGINVEFEDASLRITRVICTDDRTCAPLQSPSERTLLVAITPTRLKVNETLSELTSGDVFWIPANNKATYTLGAKSQALLVTFLQPSTAK